MLTVVVIFYLGLSLLVGVFLSRRVKKTSDFLIAGRKLGLLLTTATLSAVQIGPGSFWAVRKWAREKECGPVYGTALAAGAD